MPIYSKFIDTSKCTACRGCQTACKNWNERPAEILEFKGSLQTHDDTSPDTLTIVKMHETTEDNKIQWHFRKHQCFHCTDAACVKVCPEKALSHSETGQVVRDKEKCIGCGYCSQYCPFQVPKIDKTEKKMYKCSQCADRVANGLKPACANTCAPGAIAFGERAAMVKAAQDRLAIVKQQYPEANLYGLDILDGTNTFYLLLKTPEFYGLPAKPTVPTSAVIWKDIISPVGKVLPVAALGAIAVSSVYIRLKGNQTDKGGH